jgi:hypothetical protein
MPVDGSIARPMLSQADLARPRSVNSTSGSTSYEPGTPQLIYNTILALFECRCVYLLLLDNSKNQTASSTTREQSHNTCKMLEDNVKGHLASRFVQGSFLDPAIPLELCTCPAEQAVGKPLSHIELWGFPVATSRSQIF